MRRAFTWLLLLGFGFGAAAFEFAAIGDLPYRESDYPEFAELVAAINSGGAAFTVHVGDIKSGSSPCSDQNILAVKEIFQTFTEPLIYTPGDNEWTDCHRELAGNYDPLERLDFLRRNFFPDQNSLGQNQIALERQAEPYRENSRWIYEGLVFATLHVVGSSNNIERNSAEYSARNQADLAWLRSTFALAREQKSPAVVIFMQADPRFASDPEQRAGFNDLISSLTGEVSGFPGRVLLVHGDSHRLIIDQPLELLANFTRLQVPGDHQVDGVMVNVDPQSPGFFSFRLILNRPGLLEQFLGWLGSGSGEAEEQDP